MSSHLLSRLRNPALLMALAAAFPVVSYAGSAANVDFAVGNVTAVNVTGVQRPLTKGAEISNGDTIRTGDGGRAQVRFSDGAMISLQPETEFRVDNYQYSGKADGEEKGFFSLLKGGLRTITGWVGRTRRNDYQVTTAVATIGIRGTEYSAGLGASGNDLTVATGEGLVEVCNAMGCVLLASGESGSVQGNNAPRRTDSRPQLPPAQPDSTQLPIFSSGNSFSDFSAPTSPMPISGSATYSTILSKSVVTEKTGAWAPGTLNSASLTVNFGANTFNTSLKGAINASTFAVSGNGTITGNGLSSTTLSGTGGVCGTGCTGSVSGTFYGSSAERAGISYSIETGLPTKTISGSAVLGK
ncbi:MAG: FecR domain-containing protein [Betaproteobacteria bacterium]